MIPQISLIMGPAAGGAVYSPAITDFIVMVDETSHMFITGPDVIKTVTGEEVTFEELGGAHAHNAKSGIAHYQAADEEDASTTPGRCCPTCRPTTWRSPPVAGAPADPIAAEEITSSDLELDTLIPDSPNQPYDMHTVIAARARRGRVPRGARRCSRPTSSWASAGSRGASVGVVANQPMHFAGSLDIDASEKAARFVRTCDAFNIPVLTFVDVPGFLPGTDQEWNGIIRRGAKLIYAYAEATVPKVTVITRKAYGGAYDVMGSKHLGADVNLAWPTAQIAVMGAQGAVNILYRKRAGRGRRPGRACGPSVSTEYEDTLANPYIAAERGYVDAVIRPSETRAEITRALRTLRTKRADPAAQEAREHPPVAAAGVRPSRLWPTVAGGCRRLGLAGAGQT